MILVRSTNVWVQGAPMNNRCASLFVFSILVAMSGACSVPSADGEIVSQLQPILLRMRSGPNPDQAGELIRFVQDHPETCRGSIEEQIEREPEGPVRVELEKALAMAPPLVLRIRPQGEVRTHDPVQFLLSVRNVSRKPQKAIVTLRGCPETIDVPRFSVDVWEISGPSGIPVFHDAWSGPLYRTIVFTQKFGSTPKKNCLHGGNPHIEIREISPGKEIPSAEYLRWVPKLPGKYRVAFSCDPTIPATDNAEGFLSGVPPDVLQSSVILDVKN